MPLRVLIIDDNPADVNLIREAMQALVPCTFHVIEHGDKALEFVRTFSSDEFAFRPDVIVLDFNLPGHDGAEVLDRIRHTDALTGVPVAVVSSCPRDILRQRVNRADCYVTKPSELDAFMAIGKEILEVCRRGRNTIH